MKEALLRLPEDALERLIVDAGNALTDTYDSLLCAEVDGTETSEECSALTDTYDSLPRGYTGDEADNWMKSVGMEPFGASMLPDDLNDSFHTGCRWRKMFQSLRDYWSSQLRKSPHASVQQLSFGLIELVDGLKGRFLNPFWYRQRRQLRWIFIE
ncbi:hypothetical protein GGI1_05495 [Acidithiobacillus sp. GGI-221]|nr:hypothetical protein GGI1_05495 [Acidithiobacillus sp. GGI-221]